MKNRSGFYFALISFGLLIALCSGPSLAEAAEPEATAGSTSHAQALTTGDTEIPVDELTIKLVPMSTEQLWAEAKGWHQLLKKNVYELSLVKLAIKKDNAGLEKAKPAEDVDDGKKSPSEEPAPLTPEEQKLTDEKDRNLEKAAKIREQRTILIDRLNAVLDEITNKVGHTDQNQEKEEVLEYRRYIKAVGGTDIDVSDAKSAKSTIINWLESKEGGIRWGKNIGQFLLIIAIFWLLGILLSSLLRRLLKLATHTSFIMKRFMVDMARRLMIFVGFLIGLSALEISVAPVLAVIGATGFVVAFALQNTLSNFASGLMIMFYRPFDVGDLVDVSGVLGKVRSMTFVSTTIMTPDNKLMVVPNNSIWGNIITNVTGSHIRRVDLKFGIGYSDDIDKAQKVLEGILSNSELILDDPAPEVHLHELADSSVNFVVRPWVNTDDYWPVYWQVTREVKKQFDANGISIPFPQRDVHVFESTAEAFKDHKTEESP